MSIIIYDFNVIFIQASTDETSMSGSQNYNSDIATAAIATGILRHSPKRGDLTRNINK